MAPVSAGFKRHRHRAGWGGRVYFRIGSWRRWLQIGWFHGPDITR